MNLQETVNALERVRTENYPEGITVAITLGEHSFCLLDSNCPIAIQLRKIVEETGVTLPQLLEGLDFPTAPKLISSDLPEIDGAVTIAIAGERIELDLSNVIKSQIRDSIWQKIQGVNDQAFRVKALGDNLYTVYLREINKVRTNHALPQLSFPISELIKYNFFITAREKTYIFVSPIRYHPEYIVNNGIRYELSPKDKKELERDIYIQISIASGKFISILLLDNKGDKFHHYHGGGHDCWGTNKIPDFWDGTLKSLHNLKMSLMFSLTTINYNSLMVRIPKGLTDVGELLYRSTKLGREGEIQEPVPDLNDEPSPTRRTHWGGR